MSIKNILPILAFAAAFAACTPKTSKAPEVHTNATPETAVVYGTLDTATFASGCFWCVEAIFESLTGVKEVVSGYAGGHTKNPTYEEVCSHTTGHTETVQVYYGPKMVTYETLLKVYFASMDPTQVEGQGPDHGDSYRSVIFYHNAAEQQLAEAEKKKLGDSGQYKAPIAVIIEPLKVFYEAEGYHQNYEKNHPENPYVRGVSVPRLKRMQAKFPELLKGGTH